MCAMRRPTATTVVTALVVGAASVFVFSQLRPGLLFADTTPAGGDMGAHVWGPAYMRDHLLPSGRLFGWAPDWYAGMPYPTFYFPLPTLLIVLLDLVLPYGIAFKLVTVLGLVTLPMAAWAFGRLAGLPSPGPACLGIATLPFLFDRSFTIYGGNIPSTLAGEFSFSISLSVALLFLGVYARGLTTGRRRALAAVLLAVTGLCHVVPVFLALSGALLLTFLRLFTLPHRNGRQLFRFCVPVAAVAAAIGAVWWLPFLWRIPYTNDMGWEKLTTYSTTLFGERDQWLLVLALIGAVASIAFRRPVGIFLIVLAAFWGTAFVAMPQGRLWNGRILPLWIICLYLLAGVAVSEVGRALGRLWVETPDSAEGLAVEELLAKRRQAEHVASLITPVVALVLTVVFVAAPLQPSWLPVDSASRSFIPDWVEWNYNGYERKTAYPEYRDVVTTMDRVGRDVGCGRAMWEYESEQDRFGTPMALMLLPYWTDGCIGSVEGLFFESSATTPYHFLNQSELSVGASRPQRDLPYHDFDVARGIDHLRLLGVRYYLAFSEEARNAARALPEVRSVGSAGPWSVTYKDGAKDRVWEVFDIAGSEIVSPLQYEPVVMTGIGKGGESWQDAAVDWYQDPGRWDVPLAAGGPREWAQVEGADPNAPRKPLPPVRVSNVEEHDQSIEFDVDRVGTPVLVKASYFPNWRVSGARGVWRVTPNQMVVIPTERHVKLSYGYTPVDLTAWGLTFLGVAGAVFLWRRRPVDFSDAPTGEPVLEQRPEPDWPVADDAGDRELATMLDTGSEGD